MILYLIITAITVSVDSFLCGFSLSLSSRKKFPLVLVITLTVYLMCNVTNYATYVFTNLLNEKTVGLGGIVLIAIGIYNLIKKESPSNVKHEKFIIQSITAGFAVGLDGAFANLSLSLMGINAFYVPLTIAIAHGIMIGLSVTITHSKICNKIKKVSAIAPILLILLGTYKIISIF